MEGGWLVPEGVTAGGKVEAGVRLEILCPVAGEMKSVCSLQLC